MCKSRQINGVEFGTNPGPEMTKNSSAPVQFSNDESIWIGTKLKKSDSQPEERSDYLLLFKGNESSRSHFYLWGQRGEAGIGGARCDWGTLWPGWCSPSPPSSTQHLPEIYNLTLKCMNMNMKFKAVLRGRSRWSRNYFGTWSRSRKYF